MKKLLLLIAGLGLVITASAQNVEVVNAYNYLKNNELNKAKESIDKAITDAKTGINAKTWYYRGLIYQGIAESEDPKVNAYDPEALDKCLDSYLKSMELDQKKMYVNDVKKRIPYVLNRYVNNGINAYKAKDYVAASNNFERSFTTSEQLFNKIDTPLLYNMAIAAQLGGMKDKQKSSLSRLIDLKYPEAEIYRSMSGLYLAEKDTNKAMEYIALGRTAFPAYNALMIDELNIYIARGQTKQMIDKMVAATEADPKNKTLKFALGATYDNMGKKLEAEAAYKAAIALDSTYFDAYYNLGAMHYNSGVEVYNKTKDLPMSKEKEYNAGKKKYTESFNKSLPYLERALALQPNDVNTMLSLKEVYAKLDMLSKSAEMRKRIEATKKK
jgi:Tfp pilus assembly protein PilF